MKLVLNSILLVYYLRVQSLFLICLISAVAVQGAEPPPSAVSETSGREGRSARLRPLSPCGDLFLTPGSSIDLLPPSHTPRTAGATSKLAPVARGQCPRVLHSGPTTANGFDSRLPIGGRAREHRELNRQDNPRTGPVSAGRSTHSDPLPEPWTIKRKPGHVHVVRKALRAFRDDERASLSRTTGGRGATMSVRESPALEE